MNTPRPNIWYRARARSSAHASLLTSLSLCLLHAVHSSVGLCDGGTEEIAPPIGVRKDRVKPEEQRGSRIVVTSG